MSNLTGRIGGWDVNVSTDKFPQKVATAVGKLNDLFGAEYNPIAYIGSQVVNGTNHAVLLEQTIVAGKDTKNIVMAIFHETNDGIVLSSIERVVESGGELGGLKIDVQTDIPEEAQNAIDAALDGFVGSKINPFALLATQVTKGVNYVFAAELVPVVQVPVTKVALVVVNPLTKNITFIDILGAKNDVSELVGYAFTWLK